MRQSERLPNSIVSGVVERIQIFTQSSTEENRLLGNNGKPLSQIVKAKFRKINSIDFDLSPSTLHQSEEADCQTEQKFNINSPFWIISEDFLDFSTRFYYSR